MLWLIAFAPDVGVIHTCGVVKKFKGAVVAPRNVLVGGALPPESDALIYYPAELRCKKDVSCETVRGKQSKWVRVKSEILT